MTTISEYMHVARERGYNVERWAELVSAQRRGDFGELSPIEADVFSVLAHWDNGLPADELSIRAAVDAESLPHVCLSLAEKLDRCGAGDVHFGAGVYRLGMSV